MDRLSRSQKDTLYLIEDVFIPNDVAFISIQESFNTNTPFGRAMIGILSVFAQLERENIFERTRSGMQKRVEAGFWPGGGHAPFGYDYDNQRGILVPNNDAEKVRYLYDQYLAGKSLQQIADDLGLKYEKVAYNILTRKTNAGYITYNDTEYRGLHEPIVSLSTYEAAMKLLQQRANKKLVTRTDHLLTGLLVCGVCGAKMRYQKWGPNKWKIVCYSRQKSKQYLVKDPNCDNEYVSAETIERGVLDAVFSASRKYASDTEKVITSLSADELLKQQHEQESKKLKRLYTLYSVSDDDILLETIAEVQKSLRDIETKLADETAKQELQKEAIGQVKRLSSVVDLWPHMDTKEQRAILCDIVHSIKITHGVTEIHLNAEKSE